MGNISLEGQLAKSVLESNKVVEVLLACPNDKCGLAWNYDIHKPNAVHCYKCGAGLVSSKKVSYDSEKVVNELLRIKVREELRAKEGVKDER